MRDLVDDPHPERSWLLANVAHCRTMLSETMERGGDPMGEMAWAGLVEKWQDKLDGLPAVPAKAPASPVGGNPAVGRSVVHAGASEGAQRAPQRDYTPGPITIAAMEAARKGEVDDTPADWVSCWVAVHNAYAAAQRAMGPEPMALAGTEAWVEDDESYRRRLVPAAQAYGAFIRSKEAGIAAGYRLDDIGRSVRFPRARLVAVQQGEPDA